jgi:3-deoxy-D-manno-octulosonic-acid transferase
MMLLYNLLWPIGLLVFLPGFLLKMFRRGGYRKNFGQRFALYDSDVRQRLREYPEPIWMHAVSVGEVMIALKLAEKLRALRPSHAIVLTTTTATGYAFARKSASPCMTVLYTPLDFWPIMHRAFRFIAPRQIVLIEAEVWPNMMSEATRRKVPVALANARLSTRSERKFLRFRHVLAPIFRRLSLLCVTDAEDVARWQRIGAPVDRMEAVGNIKFDPDERPRISDEPRRFLDQIGVSADRPVLFGGSTHRGEEEILADVFNSLRQEIHDLFLVLAPRHVERLGEIAGLLRRRNLHVARRTRAETPMPTGGETTPDVLLIGTTGELALWYEIATVVFVGKSLTAHGGQNPVEAIAAGKPVIFGPHMENFAALAKQLREKNAAACASDRAELETSVRRLLSEPATREQMNAAAARVLAPHRGATARTATLIDDLFS